LRVNKLYHCSYSLSYHFVFVTKYRRKCFTGAMLDRLKEVVQKLCVDWEAELIEMNGEEDHVHFLLGLNPKCAPSVVANNFKTVTSRLLRKEFPVLQAKYKQPVLWSRSYFVASVGGAPLSVIKQYIEQQARPL
jgi:putative transposase